MNQRTGTLSTTSRAPSQDISVDQPGWIHGSSWERRAASHRKLIRIATVVIFAITALGLGGLALPVRSMLRSRDYRQFETQALIIKRDVEGFFAQAVQIAAQTPSRTSIRQELVAYLQGERSLESYREFAEPRLFDAVQAAPEMLAVLRFDRDGRLVLRVDGDGVPVPTVPFDMDEPVILGESFSLHRATAFYVAAPIDHPGFGRAGVDLVAIRLDSLEDRLDDAVAQIPGARVFIAVFGGSVTIPVAAGASADEIRQFRSVFDGPRIEAALTSDSTQSVRDGGDVQLGETSFVASAAEVAPGWTVVVLREQESLYGATDKGILVMAFVLVFIGAVFAAGAGWTLSLVRERTGEEARELSEVVQRQTVQLRDLLDQRELLIREVHHRIKNDMGLVRSFLRLHLQETKSDEARSAIREAESKLAVMNSIYDRLYRSKDFGALNIGPVVSRLLDDVAASEESVRINRNLASISMERSIATSLSIVVNELVSNSLKYAKASPLELTVSLRETKSGDVCLSVSDNGVGFPQRVLDGEFGFGLTMVKALVEQVEGSVVLADESASQVTVVLPRGSFESDSQVERVDLETSQTN